eukprot:g2455.t1
MDSFEVCPFSRKARFCKFHLNESLARRFIREATLSGSQLCVNRLAWNPKGTYLLSGSDDRKLALFPFPDYERPPLSIDTPHTANIFGVRFLPHTNDKLLVSGAMDGVVYIHRLDTTPDQQLERPPKTLAPVLGSDEESTLSCVEAESRSHLICTHEARVKDIEVEESVPFVVWSVGEDGTVRQTDIRENSSTEVGTSNVLISVAYQSNTQPLELKGIDINKVRPHQMAVACGDAFVRLYDRRKLSLGQANNNFPEALMMLAPPHMMRYTEKHKCNTTCVNFANRGDKLACLYHLDHCYTFDITSEGTTACTFYRPSAYESSNSSKKNGTIPSTSDPYQVPQKIPRTGSTTMKTAPMTKQETLWSLNESIKKEPDNVGYYLARAELYLQRRVHGDGSFALRDCDQAILLDPECQQALFLRCKALKACSMSSTALTFLHKFMDLFPDESKSLRAKELQDSLRQDIISKNRLTANGLPNRERCNLEQKRLDKYASGRWTAEEIQQDEWFKYYHRESQMEKEGRKQDSYGDWNPHGVWWTTQGGRRLLNQFVGQVNCKTDIKECSFLGQNDSLITCGSDDGQVYIYNAETGQPLNILKADSHVVNCVQGHPSVACLATSGIDSTVKLWSPGTEYIDPETIEKFILKNKTRLASGPMTSNHILTIHNFFDELNWIVQSDDGNDDDGDGDPRIQQCRVT